MLETRAAGKFVKVRVSGMPKHGQYRGAGSLAVSPTGLGISGKHVYSLGQRWVFGLAIALGTLVVTLGTFAPGILLVYPIVEYAWLKQGNQSVPFDRIVAFRWVREKQLLAVSFRGTPWESPCVLRSPDGEAVFNALAARLPALARA
jgi:hypothetical protein